MSSMKKIYVFFLAAPLLSLSVVACSSTSSSSNALCDPFNKYYLDGAKEPTGFTDAANVKELTADLNAAKAAAPTDGSAAQIVESIDLAISALDTQNVDDMNKANRKIFNYLHTECRGK